MRESNYVTKENQVNKKEGRFMGRDRQPKHTENNVAKVSFSLNSYVM